jgi:hypothetical protein
VAGKHEVRMQGEGIMGPIETTRHGSFGMLVIAAVIVLAAALAHADGNVPHTFQAGQTISSSQVNENFGNYAPRITLPLSIIAASPVSKNTRTTFRLTGAKDAGSSGGTITVTGAGLTAVFLRGGGL